MVAVSAEVPRPWLRVAVRIRGLDSAVRIDPSSAAENTTGTPATAFPCAFTTLTRNFPAGTCWPIGAVSGPVSNRLDATGQPISGQTSSR